MPQREYCEVCQIPLEEWEWCGRGLCEGCECAIEAVQLSASKTTEAGTVGDRTSSACGEVSKSTSKNG